MIERRGVERRGAEIGLDMVIESDIFRLLLSRSVRRGYCFVAINLLCLLSLHWKTRVVEIFFSCFSQLESPPPNPRPGHTRLILIIVIKTVVYCIQWISSPYDTFRLYSPIDKVKRVMVIERRLSLPLVMWCSLLGACD